MTTDASLPLPPPPMDQAPPWATTTWAPPNRSSSRSPSGRRHGALLVAVAAGFLAQLLFVGQLLGVNFPIWIAVVLAAGWFLRPRSATFDRLDAWLPVAAITFAVFVALREDGMLLAFDLLAACLLTWLRSSRSAVRR